MAVEIDRHWYQCITTQFEERENLTVYHRDFLDFELPKHPYKVFANIPFAIEGKVIRKLIEAQQPPTDCYLVVMKELAQRLSGREGNNMFVMMHSPWFEFAISHHFQPTDFVPRPNVSAVLFHFHQRKQSLLSWRERQQYQRFVELAFHNGQPIRNNLRKRFSIQKID